MKTRTSVFLTAVLAAALLGMTVFGAQAAIRASAARRTLEYTYFRSLLEAQEQLQSIALQLGKTPAAGDARTQVALLAAVSREANGAAGSLTALPLSHRAMSDTVKFCNQLSEYTMTLALGAADGASPTEEDLSQLKNLQTTLKEVPLLLL